VFSAFEVIIKLEQMFPFNDSPGSPSLSGKNAQNNCFIFVFIGIHAGTLPPAAPSQTCPSTGDYLFRFESRKNKSIDDLFHK
jgi:hypothetical protein